MEAYSIVAIIIRLILVFSLWQTGKLALVPRNRTTGNVFDLISAVGLFFGLWFGLFTLVLLIKFGLQLWQHRKRGIRLGPDVLVFILTAIIFLKGPGVISLDKLLGNI